MDENPGNVQLEPKYEFCYDLFIAGILRRSYIYACLYYSHILRIRQREHRLVYKYFIDS
jgi:hypothetical protein